MVFPMEITDYDGTVSAITLILTFKFQLNIVAHVSLIIHEFMNFNRVRNFKLKV